MPHQSNNNDSIISIILGFITFIGDIFLENMGAIDSFMAILLKFTSLTSFFVFMFLNYPKIITRINDIKKNK